MSFEEIKNAYNEEIKAIGVYYKGVNYTVMTNTEMVCASDKDLKCSIDYSVKNQYMVRDEETVRALADGPTTAVTVEYKRTFEAAGDYKGRKVTVLNFANNHSIGGDPIRAGAQEESLCRCSTLYPCLKAMKEDFYDYHTDMLHNGEIGEAGNDDLIYTPSVTVFKTDESLPLIMDKEDWYKVDVITCAAPQNNYGRIENLDEILKKRIFKIIEVAKKENPDVLVLGAFGCGAFGNPSEVVAAAFKEALEEYHFDKVVFAMKGWDSEPSEKYLIFKDVF